MGVSNKNRCNSYDVFDTLLGRWYFTPASIFQEIEQKTGFVNFTRYRKRAERAAQGRSFQEIYAAFQKLTQCSDERLAELRKLELLIESKRLFPMGKYVKDLHPSDVAISDMYLSKSVIGYLLKKNNIHFQKEHLYVYHDGKSSGHVYPLVREIHDICCHTGDNIYSDIERAVTQQINTQLCNHHFTGLEREIINHGFSDIALLSRVLRLYGSQHSSNLADIWRESAELTVPVLILMAMAIRQLSLKNKFRYLLFNQRDCCHLLKIYKALYPDCRNAKAFYGSRRCFYTASSTFVDYAKKNLEGSLMIDLAMSGQSALYFNEKTGINFEIFTLFLHKAYFNIAKRQRAKIKLQCLINHIHHRAICDFELLNLDLQGSIIDYTDRAIRAPLEYSRKDVRITHQVVDKAVELIRKGFHLPSVQHAQPYRKIQRLLVILGKYAHYVPCDVHTKGRIENSDNYSNSIAMGRGLDHTLNKLAYYFYYAGVRSWIDRRIIKKIKFNTHNITASGTLKIRYKRCERKRMQILANKSKR